MLKEPVSGEWKRLFTWSLGLLAIAVVVNLSIAAAMLALLPQGKLFDLPAIQVVPVSFMLTWGAGVIAAHRRSQSIMFAAKLAVVGAALLLVLPICFFIAIFLINGPLHIR